MKDEQTTLLMEALRDNRRRRRRLGRMNEQQTERERAVQAAKWMQKRGRSVEPSLNADWGLRLIDYSVAPLTDADLIDLAKEEGWEG